MVVKMVKDKKCCVDGCEIQARCKGFCAKHYSEQVRQGKIKQKKRVPSEILIDKENEVAFIITLNKDGDEKLKFIIDIDDVDKVKEYRWYVSGTRHKYCTAKRKNKIILHRLIMGVTDKDPKEVQVDHINGNTLDNRKCNLRIVNPHQNSMNKNKNNYGNNSHNGVHYLKRNKKWRAYITFNGEWIHLGLFETEEEAIKVRIEAEKKYFKEYRRKE